MNLLPILVSSFLAAGNATSICVQFSSSAVNEAFGNVTPLQCRGNAYSQKEVIIQAPSSIVIGYDELDIRCKPDPAWSIQSITRIQLYKNTKGELGSSNSEVVFMYLNLTVLTEQFQWGDLSVKTRGTATGLLNPTTDSFLRLLIPASSTLCDDAASYRCEISGTDFGAPSSRFLDFNVTGLGRADEINDVTVVLQSGYSSAADRYDYNSVLEIMCNSTVGLPPNNLHWCLQTSNMSELLPFPSTDGISTSEVIADGVCQNRQESSLVYQVTEVDRGTQIMCEVTNVSDCTTNLLNVSYYFDVVFGRVNMTATTNITLRQDSLDISCFQATTGEGLHTVDSMDILRGKDGKMANVVSVVVNSMTGTNVIVWYDTDLRERAIVTGDVTAPSSAFIRFTIPANLSKCDDITTYRCQLTAVSVAGTTVSDQKDSTIHADTLPEEISPLQIVDSKGISVTSGGAVQVGETIRVTCNGTVGNPPQPIRWCIRKFGGTFQKYTQTDDITISEVNSLDDCQNSQNSTLSYNVTSGDVETTFLCDIGGGEVCGGGIVTSEVSIYAVDIAIRVDVPRAITTGENDMLIRCFQTAAGIGLLREPEIRLYRNTSVFNESKILSLATDSSSNLSIVTWFDEEFKTRAEATGDISNLASAYLAVVVNATHVTCLDEGYYRCVLDGKVGGDDVDHQDGAPVVITVLPEDMEQIVVRTDKEDVTNERTFPIGSQLTLVCNSTVGWPVLEISWCVRRMYDDQFTLLGPGDTSVPVLSGSCQYRQTSELHLNVTSLDSNTMVMCEVGNLSTCGSGLVNTEVHIYAVDLALTTDVTTTVLSGEELNVTCFQSASGIGELLHSEITLYRNTSDAIHTDDRVVSLRHNSTSNTAITVWYDDTAVTRATVDGDVSQSRSAYLSFVISNVTCVDRGLYRCEMTGFTPTSVWLTRGKDELIEVELPPDYIENITGQTDDKVYADRGSFSPGTQVVFTCNGTVGNPPGDMVWCVMFAGESVYSRYNDSSVVQSEPFPKGQCQYMRTGVVNYTVTSRDTHTRIRCEVGYNTTCDESKVRAVFEIFAVDVSINLYSAQKIIGGFDQLNVTCNASDVSSLMMWDMRLYRNTTDVDTAIVSFHYNGNTSKVTWLDSVIETQGTVTGWIENEMYAILEFSVGAEVTCIDEGYYTCIMHGETGSGDALVIQNRQYIEVIELPDLIADIKAETNDRVYYKEGLFPVGSSVTLLCNGTVGRPALELQWCMRRAGHEAMEYEGIVNQSDPIPFENCQYMRTNTLVYKITAEDTRTEFTCDVGDNVTCGGGLLSSIFTLYSALVSVEAVSTSKVTSGVDTANITCSVTGLRLFYNWTLNIHRNLSEGEAGEDLLISLVHSDITNISKVIWRNPDVQSRADYSIEYSDIDTAKLILSIIGDRVTCLDGGVYRCELLGDTISGDNTQADDTAPVMVIVAPVEIEEVRGEGAGGVFYGTGIFPLGSSLALTCNSSVGNPPLDIYWCLMTTADSQWSLYPNASHITQSGQTYGSCDLQRMSTLTTEVEDFDISTVYLCEVGQNMTCGHGLLNTSFSVYAVDVNVAIQGSTYVIDGEDELLITCSQNASGIGLIENASFSIYHHSEVLQRYRLVTLTYDSITGNDKITWHTSATEDLWEVMGSTTPLSAGYLQLTLPNVTCLDMGTYECVVKGQVGNNNFSRTDKLDVDVKVLPDRMEAIKGQFGNTVLTGKGRVPIGRTVSLLCNSTVGNPPSNLHWIFKRINDTDFTLQNDTDQSVPIASGSCQLRRTSRLIWTVSSADEETMFLCMAGTTHLASYINATFVINAIPCDVDCSVVTTEFPPPPSAGVMIGVIAASIAAPISLLAIIITLIIFWKFPGARALLRQRKSYDTKVEPHDSGLDIQLDLSVVGTSAPPTETSITNGHGPTIKGL